MIWKLDTKSYKKNQEKISARKWQDLLTYTALLTAFRFRDFIGHWELPEIQIKNAGWNMNILSSGHILTDANIHLGIILSGSLCVGIATGSFCICRACSNRPDRLWEYRWQAFPDKTQIQTSKHQVNVSQHFRHIK